MSDRGLRDLQRRWEAEPTEENASALLRAKLRAGMLDARMILSELIRLRRLVEFLMMNTSYYPGSHDTAIATDMNQPRPLPRGVIEMRSSSDVIMLLRAALRVPTDSEMLTAMNEGTGPLASLAQPVGDNVLTFEAVVTNPTLHLNDRMYDASLEPGGYMKADSTFRTVSREWMCVVQTTNVEQGVYDVLIEMMTSTPLEVRMRWESNIMDSDSVTITGGSIPSHGIFRWCHLRFPLTLPRRTQRMSVMVEIRAALVARPVPVDEDEQGGQ